MTREEEFDLTLAQREEIEKAERREAQRIFERVRQPLRPALRQPEPLDVLNAAFARISREIAA